MMNVRRPMAACSQLANCIELPRATGCSAMHAQCMRALQHAAAATLLAGSLLYSCSLPV